MEREKEDGERGSRERGWSERERVERQSQRGDEETDRYTERERERQRETQTDRQTDRAALSIFHHF